MVTETFTIKTPCYLIRVCYLGPQLLRHVICLVTQMADRGLNRQRQRQRRFLRFQR
jgi:hypothetical protein